MKIISLLGIILFCASCSKSVPQKVSEIVNKPTEPSITLDKLVVGNCYAIENRQFKLTAKGEFGVGLYQYKNKQFSTYPVVDFLAHAKEVSCLDGLDKQIVDFLKKYEKAPLVMETNTKFKPGQCIHFENYNVLLVAVNEEKYYYVYPQVVVTKLHMLPYESIKRDWIEYAAVRTDCWQNLSKEHEKYMKTHVSKN